ncbi:MAG: HesA/MoeB/ThiF family protein [Nitrospirae bacterium]|nr:HesA/MoeB/ThiF family protein [Nitrospirota bacterium]
MPDLTSMELERYRRQMILPGFGLEAQRRLKAATALVSGIGGVGGTAALYLAVAGIGRLVFAHYGNLTLSNMNRQILMTHDWIGKNRNECGKTTIQRINPDVEVETVSERVSEANADRLLEGVQVALDARPNFHERRALNAACVRRGVPMVEAAMNGMEGYLTTFIPGKTPCLHCLYPEDPEWEELGFPVLGAVSGSLGCLMAIEAMKLITGYGKVLTKRMLIFDAADMRFRSVTIRRDPACPVCGKGR